MRKRRVWMWTLIGLLTASLLVGCSENPNRDPSTGSESHFLESCEATRDCVDGLACRCGICTVSCATEATCSDRGEATCAASGDLGAQCRSAIDWAGGLCLAPCESDGDCGAKTRCSEQGYCQRRNPPGARPDSDAGGGDTGLDPGADTDTRSLPEDAAAGDTAEAEADAAPGGLDPRSGQWEPVGGPPGGIQRLVRVDDTIFAYSTRDNADSPLVARSTDGGATWQPARSTDLDAIMAASKFATAAEADDGWYVLSDGVIYRRDGSGSWNRIADDVPSPDGGLHAVGDTLAMVAHGEESTATAVATSDDGGKTWRRHQQRPAGRILNIRTWNGRIYGTGYGSVVVSDDHGESWRTPGSDNAPIGVERWIAFDGRLVATSDHTSRSWQFATSSDGISWQTHELSTAMNRSSAALAPVDGTLMGLTETGGVGEVDLDGTWTRVTDGFGREHLFQQIMPVPGGFLALDWRLLRRWTPADGWHLAPIGANANAVTLSTSGDLWASGEYLFEHTAGGWATRELPSGGEHYSTFSLDETIYAVDQASCLYRRVGDRWRFVLQWRSSGIARNCDPKLLSHSIRDLVELDGSHYAGFAAEGGLYNLDAGEYPVPDAPPVEALATDGSTLWMIAEDRLLELVDGKLVDRTPEPATIDAERVAFSDLFRLQGTRGRIVLGASTGDNAGTRQLVFDGQGWQLLPPPPAEYPGRLGAVTEAGVWAIADGTPWVYDLSDEEWVRADAGLPPARGLHRLSTDGHRLVGTLHDGGVWRFAPK